MTTKVNKVFYINRGDCASRMAPFPPPLLPPSSLRLLLPPLRLLTASLWRVAKGRVSAHYGMLEEFVYMATEAVPHLLSGRSRRSLLLALRAKMSLSLPDSSSVPTLLDRIRSISMAREDEDDDDGCCAALLTLSNKLSHNPEETQHLLKEVLTESFDEALQSLLSDFLSRLEDMFPVPDFKQVASWLDTAPTGLEDVLQEVDRAELHQLLTNRSFSLEKPTHTGVGVSEKTLLSIWSHPFFTISANPEPPYSFTSQSEAVPLVVQAELEEEHVIGQREAEESHQNSGGGSEEVQQVERLKDLVLNSTDQSESAVAQSERSSSEVTANAMYAISHNSQRVAHKCPKCAKCFIYRSQVLRHLRSNKSCSAALSQSAGPEENQPPPLRSLSCFQCSSVFRTKAELLKHQRSHRLPPLYSCPQCDRAFRHLSGLVTHRQTHQHRSASSCNQTLQSVDERDAHQQKSNPLYLSCSICNRTFSSQNLLLRHLQAHAAEGAKPRYTCRYCDLSFSGVTQLRIHQRSHASRKYPCDQCNKSYASLTGLHAHRLSHAPDSHFLCSQCGKRFKTRAGLVGHLRGHGGERPYRCPHCPKTFAAAAALNVHVRRHTGERPYVCKECGKAWPSGGDLQKHMRTHTGEKPYTCEDCGRSFSISCHLTEHRRTHTGERPFVCAVCGKCLRRKFDLNKHLLTHSSVRPYSCSTCSKTYTRRTHLTRHLLTHTPSPAEPP